MIQIPRKQNRSCLRELQEQRLVPRRVAGRKLDHHGAIAEHVMILAFEEQRFSPGQLGEVSRGADGSHFFIGVAGSEDGIAVALLHNPRRPGEQIRIGHVIAVIMRKREICNIRRRIADGGQLREQRTIHNESASRLRRNTVLERVVRNLAGVPHHRAARMHDEEARCDHIGIGQFPRLEPHRVPVRHVDLPAIENIEPQRLGWRRLARLRVRCRPYCQPRYCGGGKKKIHRSTDHGRKHITAAFAINSILKPPEEYPLCAFVLLSSSRSRCRRSLSGNPPARPSSASTPPRWATRRCRNGRLRFRMRPALPEVRGISFKWPAWRSMPRATSSCCIAAPTRSWNSKAAGSTCVPGAMAFSARARSARSHWLTACQATRFTQPFMDPPDAIPAARTPFAWTRSTTFGLSTLPVT